MTCHWTNAQMANRLNLATTVAIEHRTPEVRQALITALTASEALLTSTGKDADGVTDWCRHLKQYEHSHTVAHGLLAT